MDVDDIVRKFNNWKLKLPRVQPFYAVKCNDTEIVLRVLAALGTGFDCASKEEVSKVLELGVDPQRIVFAHTTKQIPHLRHALAEGVDLMTFDNTYELHKIKKIFPATRLLLRFRYDARKADYKLGKKFGAELCDVESLLAVANDLGLNVVGVSFHVGSGCLEPQIFTEAIAVARNIFDVAHNFDFNFDLLDIGGGFPGHIGSDINEFAEIINAALILHFPDEAVRIIAEPGRYFVESSCTLVTTVHSKRRVLLSNNEVEFMYYINDGMYGSFGVFRNRNIKPRLPFLLKEIDGTEKLHLSSIWGPTCDSADMVIDDLRVPELHIGDLLVFRDRGAYSLTCACNFNGMSVPRVIATCTEDTWNHLYYNLHAFVAMDIDVLVQKYEEWKLKLPRVQPFYAVKTNDNLHLLRVLAALGIGFDCSSKEEISKVLELGVDPKRIVFAHTTKQIPHLRHALAERVDLMTFDNTYELHKIKKIFPTARLMLRFRFDDPNARYTLGMKFGAKVQDVEPLLLIASQLGLNVVGVSFHVGSGCSEPQIYAQAIGIARNIFDLAKSFDFSFNILDIGGGFPGHTGSSIDEFAEFINGALSLNFSDETVQIIAEPGRYFSESSCTLATNIHSKRRVVNPNNESSYMYYVNDGMYGTFGGIRNTEELPKTPIVLKDVAEGCKLYPSSIWGPTCDSADLLLPSVKIPELNIGDWLAFPDAGAYTLSCASKFNGMPLSRVIATCTEATW
ncbi:hypothetical protein B566_EDAN013406 [Ephemera danica]|nr:hypothetical protein B566_EDAN013406 [Ephemera danica]